MEKLQKIPEPIRTALREFLEWYDYTMPVNIELNENRLELYIQHDITEELEYCTFECVQQTKKLISKKVDEEKISESCRDGCFVDVTANANAMFDDIRKKLFEYLDKYGIKRVWWQEGWEDVYRYFEVHIQ